MCPSYFEMLENAFDNSLRIIVGKSIVAFLDALCINVVEFI